MIIIEVTTILMTFVVLCRANLLTKYLQAKKIVYHLDLAFRVHGNSIPIIIFEKIRIDDSSFSDDRPNHRLGVCIQKSDGLTERLLRLSSAECFQSTRGTQQGLSEKRGNLPAFSKDYGTYPVNWNDNVLIFYVTIKNDGDVPITASVKMIECCEQLSNNDTACNHMRLDGSRIKLEKRSVTNCTLHYPNAYPYNRKGTCNANITLNKNMNETVEFLRNITFDTTVRSENVLLLLRESMLSSRKSAIKNFRLCEHPDEDPLDLCEPVNCHMKYRGFRSLFDSVKRQCVPVPVCNGRPKTNSSVTVYDPFSNSCIERTNNISIDDIDSILHGTRDDVFLNIKTKTEHPYRSYVRCHHGKTDETNRTCICNDGWDSFMNFSVPIVSTVPVHMCTVKIPNKSYYGFPSSLTMLDPKDIVSFTAQYQ